MLDCRWWSRKGHPVPLWQHGLSLVDKKRRKARKNPRNVEKETDTALYLEKMSPLLFFENTWLCLGRVTLAKWASVCQDRQFHGWLMWHIWLLSHCSIVWLVTWIEIPSRQQGNRSSSEPLLQFDWKAMHWCDSLFVPLRTDKLGWVPKPYVTHLLDGFSDSVWPQLYHFSSV